MSSSLHTYDLRAVHLTVAGIPISGYGPDEGVVITPHGDIGEITVGATGLTVFSRSNDFDATMTVTVLESSKSYTALAGLMKAQGLIPGAIVPLPILMLDIINGDTLFAAYGVFTKYPEMSKRRSVSTRVFELHIPDGMKNAVHGVKNLV